MVFLTVLLALALVVGAAACILRSVRERRLRRSLISALEHAGGTSGSRPTSASLAAGIRDVQTRTRAAELRTARIAASVEDSEFGIIVVDEVGAISFVNRAAERFMAGRHGDAVAEERIRELLRRAAASRNPHELEIELYTPRPRVLHIRTRPLGDDHDAMGAVAYVEDVTERRRIDAVRRDFVANASHELKTPLGALALLAETLADTDEEAARRRLADRVSMEANRMAQLVEDILDLSQVESWTEPPEPVEIGGLLAEARTALALSAEESAVELIVEPPARPVEVRGDRRQLLSAIVNLAGNAVKYTAVQPPNVPRRVTLRGWGTPEEVVVEVEDTGIGISENHLGRIFERFYRVDRARSRSTGGTGLGLAIVRHVALNHQGEVTVRSQEGAGSVFTLRLPRRRS